MKPVKSPFFLLLFLIALCACKKESFTSSPTAFLRTSADTLHFDTIFTSTGSTSRVLKIINENDKGIHIHAIKLEGGNTSPFRMNVDGIAAIEATNLDLPSGDSLYVFVTVTIDPNSATLPFVVRDSISISYNGKTEFVQLQAFGKNARFLNNYHVSSDESWTNDLPYVIIGGLTVDTGQTLSIGEGCRIFFHADAPMLVHGTLKANGDYWDTTRIVFSGDRLDEPYRDFPASYPGIYFTQSSSGNELKYVNILNAYQGIVAAGGTGGTQLTLNEIIIENAYDAGLTAINSSIVARNLLIANCGRNLLLVKGGDYLFEHCTFPAYSTQFLQHREPVLTLTNFLSENGAIVSANLNAVFRNCIFWGENNGLVEDEVVVLRQGSNAFAVNFEGVLWRQSNTPSNVSVLLEINNQPPLFDTVDIGDNRFSFRLKAGSPALDAGLASTVTNDLDGLPRPVNQPDLGAYEKQ